MTCAAALGADDEGELGSTARASDRGVIQMG